MAWIGLALVAAVLAVPFLGGLDAAVAQRLDAWRSCGGQATFLRVSELVPPLGGAALVAALLWRLTTGRPPRWREPLAVLVSLAGGSLLIEGLKAAVDRARPGAEFLVRIGDSYPSGHVGNTLLAGVAVLCLCLGRERVRRSVPALLGLGALVGVVAAARMYVGRHWASDVLGTAVPLAGYATLALLHPEWRWRLSATAGALVVSTLLLGAGAVGWRLYVPTGGRSSTSPPLGRLAFGHALREGRLQGQWSADGADPLRSSAWLRDATGTVVLAGAAGPVGELRVVARSHPGGTSARCRRLRVALNGTPLGERLLQLGWRAYPFPVAAELRPEGNVISLTVRDERPDQRRPQAPRAAFSEMTLHPR